MSEATIMESDVDERGWAALRAGVATRANRLAMQAALADALAELTTLRAELQAAKERAEKAEALAYVPGLRKCAKCGCSLLSTNLHVNHGAVSANNEPQDCPNGCGPMWPVTERQAGNEMIDRMEVMSDTIRDLQSRPAVTDEMVERSSHAISDVIDWDGERLGNKLTPFECQQAARAALVAALTEPPKPRQWPTESKHCMSAMDGDCDWPHCPQIRDGEPKATGRDCPLIWSER